MKVNEIFYSIQGESTYAGLPCVFVRLTGCNLRCTYCDTKFAYHDGQEMSVADVIDKINSFSCDFVELTGGEPLLQLDCVKLADSLVTLNKHVSVETNGTYDISVFHAPIVRIMDIKCPGSNEVEKINWDNIFHLTKSDNVKFVITDWKDFEWAADIVAKYELLEKCEVLFSPAFRKLEPAKLAKWILKNSLPIRFQLQLHKYIWHPTRRGV